MSNRFHPLLEGEVKRWIGDGPLAPNLAELLRGLSTRLDLFDDVRGADSEGELEAFFRLSADLLVVLDEQLRIRHLNTAFEPLGYTVATSRGSSFLELLDAQDVETARATLTSMLRTHEQVPLALHLKAASGAPRLIHWQLAADGDGTRVYGVGHDVTNQRAVEHRLGQARKLEAVGTLAAGVAHEMNTPLQFIGDNLAFIAETFVLLEPLFEAVSKPGLPPAVAAQTASLGLDTLRHDVADALEALRDGHRQVATLVQSLKRLAPSDGEAVEVTAVANLGPVFEQVIASTHTQPTFEGVTLVTELEPIPPLVCDQAALAKVLEALLSNAALAVRQKGHGRVTVSTRVEGDFAVLRVADEGCGMPAAVQARVFEPFFTTRDVGAGQGQSLAVARAVLERHNGSIEFTSAEGQGSTFVVRLPLQTVLDDADLWS
jgi:PAS domain S-box-containing protein